MLLYLTSVSLAVLLCFIHRGDSVAQGTVRLYRNGVADTSQSWSSGIVQVYMKGEWGNICDDSDFGMTEANVLCNQLGYDGADSFTNTGLKNDYGTDNASVVLEEVSCSFSSYLTISQCDFEFSSIPASSSCANDNYDVILTCDTDNIWGSSPYSGYIRLTGGTYSNQGLLEVYCNGQWGTVCDDSFSSPQANVACSTLGYNGYEDYSHLDNLRGNASQKIWLNSVGDCSSSDTCFYSCQSCPSDDVTDCDHSEDVTLECKYDSSDNKNTVIYGACSYELAALVAVIVIVVVVILVCCVFIICAIVIPVCVCCCLGVGIGAGASLSRKPRRPTTVNTTTTNSSSMVTTSNQQHSAGQPQYTGNEKMENPPAYMTDVGEDLPPKVV